MTEPSTVENPGSRAEREAADWAAAKHRQVVSRLEEIGLSLEQQKKFLEVPAKQLLVGVERWYSAAEAARFFGKTNQWIYDRRRQGKFRYSDGTEIVPVKGENGWDRYNLAIIREIALSCYRSGTVKLTELEVILTRLQLAEVGEVLFDPEEQ